MCVCVEFISKNLDLWKKFNATDKPWKRYIGMSYMIFGIKSSYELNELK